MPFDAIFVDHAAGVLADTTNGLTAGQIFRVTNAYALKHNIAVPHPEAPYPNKRTALASNLMAFPEALRYLIIRALCEHEQMPEANAPAVKRLKVMMIAR